MRTPSAPAAAESGITILVLALLLSIQPVTTDLYLPALPTLTYALGASVTQGQLTLSALLLAFGCSQLFWGPLSDRWGRRPILLAGLLMYTLAYFCLTNTLSAINIWTPQILQSFNTGSSNIVIGLLAAIPQFCTILGMIWWSRRSDRLKERKKHTILPYLFAAAGWMLASATDHSLIQLLGIIMASTGSFTAMAIFWTTPDRVISLQSRAVALAVINAIGNVGSAVSPLLIGILRDATGSFSSGLWFVAGLLVVGALVLTRIPMTQRDQQRNDHVPEPYRQH